MIHLILPLQSVIQFILFFFNDTATTEIYTLSLHDALPISRSRAALTVGILMAFGRRKRRRRQIYICTRTARCRSRRLAQGMEQRSTASMFLIRRILCPTGSGRFRRRIRRGIGERGKWRPNDLGVTGPD